MHQTPRGAFSFHANWSLKSLCCSKLLIKNLEEKCSLLPNYTVSIAAYNLLGAKVFLTILSQEAMVIKSDNDMH